MKDRPILFSGPMVRAILAGTKTQTRRVVRKQFAADAMVAEVAASTPEGWQVSGHSGLWWDDAGACLDDAIRCPYGMPGDRLWVRETHAPQADCWGSWERWTRGEGGTAPIIHYAADAEKSPFIEQWRPSIHMPRWASRITLEITGVRVERLQDISEVDALAEGISSVRSQAWDREHFAAWRFQFEEAVTAGKKPPIGPSPKAAFAALWQQINGLESWDENPWVWVVEFKRLEGQP